MPELPEVETVMRGLRGVLDGQRLSRAGVTRAGLRWPFPPGLQERLAGAAVQGFRRRGKYMLMRLSGGDSALIHLGMSGRMVARRTNAPPLEAPAGPLGPQGAASDARGDDPAKHEHLWMETAHGWRVGFQDPRRFGCVDLVPTAGEDGHRLLAGLGPEPLDAGFTAAVLGAALSGRRTPVKLSLLDQSVVAGLGNIYVSEALHRAGISPLRPSGSLTPVELERLVPAIRVVLEESIEAGGSSLRDYVRADGEVGHFQERFRVYDREGAPCPHCAPRRADAVVARVVQGGRSTFFCGRCQA